MEWNFLSYFVLKQISFLRNLIKILVSQSMLKVYFLKSSDLAGEFRL